MSVLSEALQFLGLTADTNTTYGRQELDMATTRNEQRKLAETMRALPGRFADRLSARALDQITGAAVAGQWEQAVDKLITALHARAEAVTAEEYDQLRALLRAMNMTGECLDTLLVQR
jgi:hypothetical protein